MKRWIKSQTTIVTIMLLLSLVFAGGLTFLTQNRSSSKTPNQTNAYTYGTGLMILNDNGGSGGDGEVPVSDFQYGYVASVPSRSGYTFTGYFSSTSGGTQYIDSSGNWCYSGSDLSGEIYAYANWSSGSSGGSTGSGSGGSSSTDTITIELVATAGSGGTSSVSATVGSALPSITVPTASNLKFNGYYTTAGSVSTAFPSSGHPLGGGTKLWNADGSPAVSSFTDSLKNTLASNYNMVYAGWIGKYSVTYDGNQATSGSNWTVTRYENESWYAPTVTSYFSKAGHTISFNGNGGTPSTSSASSYYGSSGWSLGSSSYANGAKLLNLTSTLGGNATLYAKWDSGPSLTLPSASRTGYIFNGWYTASSGGSRVGGSGSSYTTSSNGTLYAQWTPITYYIQYNATTCSLCSCSTSGSTATSTHTYDTAKTLTSNGYSKGCSVSFNANGGSCSTTSATSTCTFAGWATSSGGSAVYSNGQSVSNLTTVNGATVNLYATWSHATITLPTPTRSGYDFAGWYTASSGGSRVGGAGDTVTLCCGTLYAQWTPISYTLTIDPNGGVYNGNASRKTETGYIGETETLNAPVREGYTFAGWSLEDQTGVLSSFGNAEQNDTFYHGGTLGGSYRYNNYGTSIPSMEIITDWSVPQTNKKVMQLTTSGNATPGAGGFTFGSWTGDGSFQYVMILAKIPQGFGLYNARNAAGDGAIDYVYNFETKSWSSSTYLGAGTGNWQVYLYGIHTGTTNNSLGFSSINYFYISGGNSTQSNTNVTWWVGHAQVYRDPSRGSSYTGLPQTSSTTFTYEAGNNMAVALWVPNTQNLTYDANGGTIDGNSSKTITGKTGTEYVPADPVRTGYTFSNEWIGDTAYLNNKNWVGTGSNYYKIDSKYNYADSNVMTLNMWVQSNNWSDSNIYKLASCTNSGGWNLTKYSDGTVYLEYMLQGESSYRYLNIWRPANHGTLSGTHMFTVTFGYDMHTSNWVVKGYVDGTLYVTQEIPAGAKLQSASSSYDQGVYIGMECPVTSGGTLEHNFIGTIYSVSLQKTYATAEAVKRAYDATSSSKRATYFFETEDSSIVAQWPSGGNKYVVGMYPTTGAMINDMSFWDGYYGVDVMSTSYDGSMSSLTVSGAGNWETIAYPLYVTSNTDYAIEFDYVVPNYSALDSSHTGLAVQVLNSTPTNTDCTSIQIANTILPTSATSGRGRIAFNSGDFSRVYIVVNAGWCADGYTNTFQFGNWDIKTANAYFDKSITYGSTYGTLPTPTREGYDFAGWKQNIIGPTDSNRVVNNNSTDYNFTSFYLTENLKSYTTYNFTTTVKKSRADGVWAGFYLDGGYVGAWTPTYFTADWQTYTGSFTTGDVSTYTHSGPRYIHWYNGSVSAGNGVSISMCNFAVWEASGATVTSSTTVSKAYNHSLVATWTPKTYTATYDGNSGTPSETSKTVTYNSTYGDLATASRDGYTWKDNAWYVNYATAANWVDASWTQDSDGVYSTGHSGYYSHSNLIPFVNTTGSAIKISSNYTINSLHCYNANGVYIGYTHSSNGTHSVQNGTYYIRFELKTESLAYANRGLLKIWCESKPITSSSTVSIPHDHSLFPLWTVNPYDLYIQARVDGVEISGALSDYDITNITANLNGTATTITDAVYKVSLQYGQTYQLTGSTYNTAHYTISYDSASKTMGASATTIYVDYTTKNYTYTLSFTQTAAIATNVKVTATRGTLSATSCSANGGSITVTAPYSTSAITITMERVNTNRTYYFWVSSIYGNDKVSFTWTPTSSVTNTWRVIEQITVKTVAGTGISSAQFEKLWYGTGSKTTSAVINCSAGANFYAVVKEGYTFKGWYTNAEGTGTAVSTSTEFTIGGEAEGKAGITADTTYYAIATPNTYTVSFDANDGTVDTTSKSVTFDSTYGDLPTPTREGYTFMGWKENLINMYAFGPNHGTSGQFATQVTGNTITMTNVNNLSNPSFVNLVKVETGKTYKLSVDSIVSNAGFASSYGLFIQFDDNNQDTATWRLDTTKQITFTATSTNLYLKGYIAYGQDSAHYITYNNLRLEEVGTYVTSSTTMNNAYNHVLTADWSVDDYTVTFNANGGSVDPTSKTVTFGSTYGDLPTPTREGYTFLGWFHGTRNLANYKNSAGYFSIQNSSQNIIRVTPSGTNYQTTTFKVGDIIYFDFTFNGTISFLDCNDVTIPTQNYVIDGNRVYGSYTIQDSRYIGTYSFIDINLSVRNSDTITINNLWTGNHVCDLTTVTKAENHTLTASWEIKTYTVTIESNDTTRGTVDKSSVVVDWGTAISNSGNVLTIGGT